MAASKVEQWFQQASARWPGIQWDSQSFAAHVKGETPAFPLDLYLAGAAGYRIDAAWEAIHNDLGPRARAVLQRQPTADLSPDELWSETIARLIAEDDHFAPLPGGRRPAYIARYRGLVSLINYMILIAKRLGIQRKRQMRPTFSLAVDDPDDHARDIEHDAPSPADQVQGSEDARSLSRAFTAAYEKLSAEQQFLIAMVYRNGMKQKDAGAMLNWSEFKTCRSLGAAMEHLRKALRQWAGDDWTGAMAATWEACLQSCWNQVQVPPKSSSKVMARG